MGAPGPTAEPTLKSVLTWKRQGDNTVSQINFWSYSGGPPAASDLSAFAVDLVRVAGTAFAALCDTFTGVVTGTVTDISVAPVTQGEGGTPFVGTRTGAILAPATSAVINKKPDNPYRGGKPKNFLPLGTGGDVADTGLWADAFVAEVNTAYGDFLSGFVGTTQGSTNITGEAMVSYYTGGSTVTISPTTGRARNTPKKREVGGVWTPLRLGIQAGVCSDIIGSQRRRNRNAWVMALPPVNAWAMAPPVYSTQLIEEFLSPGGTFDYVVLPLLVVVVVDISVSFNQPDGGDCGFSLALGPSSPIVNWQTPAAAWLGNRHWTGRAVLNDSDTITASYASPASLFNSCHVLVSGYVLTAPWDLARAWREGLSTELAEADRRPMTAIIDPVDPESVTAGVSMAAAGASSGLAGCSQGVWSIMGEIRAYTRFPFGPITNTDETKLWVNNTPFIIRQLTVVSFLTPGDISAVDISGVRIYFRQNPAAATAELESSDTVLMHFPLFGEDDMRFTAQGAVASVEGWIAGYSVVWDADLP